ncbi:MAG: Smr/MutS family protein [Thermodesulfobacteriota bacterium]
MRIIDMEKNILKKLKKRLSFQKNAVPSEPEKKTGEKKNRNNIKVLNTEKNFEEIFKDSKDFTPATEKKEVKTVKKNRFENVKSEKIEKNKNSIPVINEKEDLIKAFENPDYKQSGKVRVKKTPTEININSEVKKSAKKKTNKNGIKVIENSSDINSAFLKKEGKNINFKSDYNSESAMLKAKKGDVLKSKPVPIEKRLEKYPAPELSLDLHGFTSVQAKLKTENFILSALGKGYFTLRIITGKGNHSIPGAVLPDLTEDIVSEMIQEKKVLHFKWEHGSKEKSGSMIVYLNRYD